jgi:hypothetical protein
MLRLTCVVAVVVLSACTAIGPEGAPGPTGEPGDAGATGPAGPQGPKGDTGATGAKGDPGATGPQGLQGIQGVKGDTGLTGAQGVKGDTGLTGSQGVAGLTGSQGPAGTNSLWNVSGTTMNYSGGNIGIGTATPDAPLQVRGPIRLGSETGTAEGPNTGNGIAVGYKGLVMRRIVSVSPTAGNVVARTSEVLIERDGTPGGLLFRWTVGGSAALAVRGTIVDNNGVVTGVHFETGNQFDGGTQAIFTGANQIIFAHLIFGNFYNADNVTEITIARSSQYNINSDPVWLGTVTSSYDQ